MSTPNTLPVRIRNIDTDESLPVGDFAPEAIPALERFVREHAGYIGVLGADDIQWTTGQFVCTEEEGALYEILYGPAA